MSWKQSIVPALGILLLSGAAAAQEESPAEFDTLQVTAGRLPESQHQVPQPVTVVGREQIERQGPAVLADALRGATGAYIQQSGPGQGIVIVRGLKGSEVLHLVDGMRVNNAFFRNSPSQYFALVDPQNIAQLDLLRGPYASLYGSDAMGGVVHVITPEERFDGERWDLRGGAALRYASADLARSSRTWVAAGDREFSVSAGFSFSEFGERRLAEPGQSPDGQGGITLEDRVNDTDYLSRAWDLKALWTPAGGHEWMAAVQVFEIPELQRYFQTVPGFSGGAPSRAIAQFMNDRAFYHARYRYSLPLAFVDRIEVHLGHQVMTDDRLDRNNPVDPDRRRDDFTFNRSALTGLTAQAESVFATHQLRYGLELYRDRVNSSAYRVLLLDGSVTEPDGTSFFSPFPDGSRADDYGVFVFDEWRLAERWLLEGGARFTRRVTDIAQGDRAFGARLADNDFTGNTGLRYALTPALAWTANIGRGFRAPNLFDLAQVGQRANNRVVVANLDLKPESVTTYDTGLKVQHGGLAAELSVFYSQYRDRIETVSPAFAEGTPECPDDGDPATNGCAQNQNVARSRYYGFEGGWRLGLTPAIALRGTLNYTWGAQEQDGDQQPANRVPPLNGVVAAELRPVAGLRIEPSVYFAGRQDRLDANDLSDSRINPAGTPGFTVVNLDLVWTVRAGLDLQLGGRNLLNKAYREHGSGIDGAGRGLVLGLRTRFD